MKYHYEAVPVLFNILLFFLMLYPFPNVYRYGCEFRKRYTDILDYAVYGVLLILFCTFGYAVSSVIIAGCKYTKFLC